MTHYLLSFILISPHFYDRKCLFKRDEHVLSVSVWVFSRSSFLPQSKNMHISFIGDPECEWTDTHTMHKTHDKTHVEPKVKKIQRKSSKLCNVLLLMQCDN